MSLFETYATTVLEAKRRRDGGWADFRCSNHDDRSASCSINLENGFVKCQASICGWEGWIDEYAEQFKLPAPPDKPGWQDGKPVRDDAGEPKVPAPTRSAAPTFVHHYDDADGKPYMRVKRLDLPGGRKSYPQSAFIDGEWRDSLPKDFKRILYRLPQLLKSDEKVVLVCEGEKSVECARKMGFVATTSPGGAEKAHMVGDWSPLSGRDVVVIADNDEPGQRHARQVTGLLLGIASSIRIMTMPGVPEKGDLVDWVDAGGTPEQLVDLIEQTEAFGMPKVVAGSLERANDSASADRAFIEQAVTISAWHDFGLARRLARVPLGSFKDPACRSAHAALAEVIADVGEAEFNPLTVMARMARRGDILQAEILSAFEASKLPYITGAQTQIENEFRNELTKDSLKKLSQELVKNLPEMDPRELAQRLADGATAILARSDSRKRPTMREEFYEWIEAREKGEDGFQIELGVPAIDRVLGGIPMRSLVIIGGAPKMGKSTLAMVPIFAAAKAGVECIVGQLEMTKEQIFRRAAAWHFQKPFRGEGAFTDADLRELKRSGDLDWFKNIHLVTGHTSIESYRTELVGILTRNRKIRLCMTDYAEQLMQHGSRTNRVDEADAGSDFAKKLAIQFNLCHILLVQYKKEYTESGHEGARLNHLKNSGKYEQDAQAVILLHHPHRFNPDITRNFVIAKVAANRDGGTDDVPLYWTPQHFRYEPWDIDAHGTVPAGAGKNLRHEVELVDAAERVRKRKQEDTELSEGLEDIDF